MIKKIFLFLFLISVVHIHADTIDNNTILKDETGLAESPHEGDESNPFGVPHDQDQDFALNPDNDISILPGDEKSIEPGAASPSSDSFPDYDRIIKNAVTSNEVLPDDLIRILLAQSPIPLQQMVSVIEKAQSGDTRFGPMIADVLPNRILLVGPPGVGKSTLAVAIANKLNRFYVFIRMSMLGTEYKNSEASNLLRYLDGIDQIPVPIVLILDEINIFADPKYTNQHQDIGAAAALWSFMDKCNKNPNVLIIATANDITKLPEQLKDRFEGKVVEVKMSSGNQRLIILKHYLLEKTHNISESYIKKLAKKTEQFSPRQLQELVTGAQRCQIVRDSLVLEACDFDQAFDNFSTSSRLLQTKSYFSIKKWLNENATMLQGISTLTHLSLLAITIANAIPGKIKTVSPYFQSWFSGPGLQPIGLDL